MKRYIVGLAAVLAAVGTTVFSVSASAAPKADTILVGISAAKTGILAPYDLQAGQLFELRIDQINKAGGVLGKQIKVKWIDTKSDKPTAATNASELVCEGAVAILTTCDFDFSFPATQAAGAKKVLALSLCASSPKAATPAIVGQYGGSMVSDPTPRASRWRSGSGRTSRSSSASGTRTLARVLQGDRGLLQGPLEAARRHRLRRGHLHRRRRPRPLFD